MNETRKMNFRIEDAITEAYEQMNERFELKKGDIVTIKPTGTPRRGPIDDQVWVIIGPQGDGYRYKDSDTGRTSWSPLEFFRDLIIRKRASVKRNNRFVLGTRESHCGTGRKDEVKKPPMHYVIYDKKTKEVYAASTKPFDKFKLDDVADDMKVKKSDLVMKKMKKGQEVDSKLKESHCGTHRKDEAKFDKLRKKLKYINPETLQDVLDGKIKLNPAEKKEFDMFMRDARKMFSASTEEVNEAPGRYSKKGDQDKYQWGDINKAMMSAGMNPSSILKVLSKLRGKALGEEVNEQLSAKFSKDFDKEAKEKGPHQDSSVYKQMRNIIKTQGFANVKTDKGSLKVDMQSAYRWLASYHMLSDKNKKNLIKMAQRSKDSLATTIRVAQTLSVRR